MKKMINNNLNRRTTIQPLGLFIALPAILIGCGGGGSLPGNSGINGESAAKPALTTPLNDTGVTYLIDDRIETTVFNYRDTVNDIDVYLTKNIDRTVIFPAAGTNT